jgi:activator of HSP90 ATPase
MSKPIKLSVTLPVTPKTLYRAWLDSKEHSNFTGGIAEIERRVGSKFTAWDGYIEGENLELLLNKRIVQSWRTNEFPEGSPNSKLEITFNEVKNGTKVSLIHSDLPEGDGAKYRKGWKEHYFNPMKEYFTED